MNSDPRKQTGYRHPREVAAAAQTHLPADFDRAVLGGIKCQIPERATSDAQRYQGEQNLRLFQAWRRCEGGTAKWNPLNTSYYMQTFTELPNYNDIPIRNYAYDFVGIGATIVTFASRTKLPDGTVVKTYGGILNDMQHSGNSAEQTVADRRGQFQEWGTNVDLLLAVLAEI